MPKTRKAGIAVGSNISDAPLTRWVCAKTPQRTRFRSHVAIDKPGVYIRC